MRMTVARVMFSARDTADTAIVAEQSVPALLPPGKMNEAKGIL